MQRYTLIIDEVSMIELDMFSNIIKQLAKARDLISENTAIFKTLPIPISIEDFYQFSSIIDRLL